MIYQLEAEHRFPTRVRIGLRAVGRVESEVQLAREPHRATSRRHELNRLDAAARLSRDDSARHAQHVLAVKLQVASLTF
jgi:hypothetical protein